MCLQKLLVLHFTRGTRRARPRAATRPRGAWPSTRKPGAWTEPAGVTEPIGACGVRLRLLPAQCGGTHSKRRWR